MCICINSGTKECNAHNFFFSPQDRKKEEKPTFSAATVVTNSRSCTVATCPQFLFSIFFANNQNTPSRHCHNRSQGPKQHCVGSGEWGWIKKRSCQKKIKKKVSNANSADLSLSTLNHMTSSGKPTSYACKRAHLISFRRCNTRQTHSACHQSVIPRLTFPLPNVRALSRASYNLVALARLRHHSS